MWYCPRSCLIIFYINRIYRNSSFLTIRVRGSRIHQLPIQQLRHTPPCTIVQFTLIQLYINRCIVRIVTIFSEINIVKTYFSCAGLYYDIKENPIYNLILLVKTNKIELNSKIIINVFIVYKPIQFSEPSKSEHFYHIHAVICSYSTYVYLTSHDYFFCKSSRLRSSHDFFCKASRHDSDQTVIPSYR